MPRVVPGVTLRMIGEGPLLKPARELAVELGIAKAIAFEGAQPNSRVREAMGCAGVFVQHSVTASDGNEEGWPVSVGEAMASGLPVVATRHPGIVDQVVESKTGYLIDEHDWEEMGNRMIELAEDPALRTRMGLDARHCIEKHGSLGASIGRLEAVLEGMVR